MQADKFCKRSGSVPGEWVCDEEDEQCGYVPTDGTCGDGGRTTTQKYVEILEFTHFTEFWTFNEVGINHKEKVQVRKVEVSVVLDLDT